MVAGQKEYPHVTVRQTPTALVVQFLDATVFDESNSAQIRDSATKILDDHDTKDIVVDLSNVTEIGSRFLGTLIVIRKRVTERGGELRLAAMTEPVNRAFRIAASQDVLDMFDSGRRPREHRVVTQARGSQMPDPSVWFTIRENDAWVIKGMLAAGGSTKMIADVFAVDESEVIAIRDGKAWTQVEYPGACRMMTVDCTHAGP